MTTGTRSRFSPVAPRRWVAAGVAAAVVLGAGAMLIARALVSPAPSDPPAQVADAQVADGQVADDVRFQDAAGGFSISYPAGWRRVTSADPQVRLLVEGDGSSMLVRMADLGMAIGPEDLDAAKKITDGLVRAAGQVEPLSPPRQVTLGGLPGYLYLYTFADPATGQQGGHAHYFLFRGQTMITIVFQTVPAKRFAALAPMFDRIGETLRAVPPSAPTP